MSANIEFVDRLWGEQGLVRWMVEQLPDAVYLSNLDTGELTYLNEAAETVTGFAVEELQAIGVEGARARVHPDDLERYLAGIRHLLEQGGSETLEFRWLHKDGSYRWLSNSRALLPTDQGNLKILVGTLRDVTAQKQAEEEHKRLLAEQTRERTLLKTIMENTSTDIAYLDRDFRFAQVNSAYVRDAGYSREELIGRNHFDLFPDAENQAIFEQVRDTGEPVRFEAKPFVYANQPEKGVTYWIWTLVPVKGPEGHVEGLVLSLLDITEQERTRLALRESERRARVLLDSVPTTFFLMAPDGTLLDLNAEAARRLKVPYEEAVGQNVYALLPPKAAARRRAWAEEVLRTRQPMRNQDERGGWVLDHRAHPVLDDEDRVTAVAVYAEDITERVRAEQALRESEARYRSLYNATTAGIVLQDTEGQIVEANEAAEEIIGLTIDQMRGLTSMDPRWRAVRKDGSPFPGEEHPIVVARRSGQTVRDVTIGMIQPNGETHWVLVSAAPVMDPDTNVTMGAAATFIDITEQKETEQALRESEERYRTLFKTMTEGFALHEMLYDEQGTPNDYRFLEINSAFEQQTGLRATDVIGRTVSEVIPDVEQLWIERYGEVVRTGEPVQFESWSGPLGRCYSVSAFRTGPGRFAVIFLDITDRVQAEGSLRESEERFKLLADAAEQLLRSAQPQADIQQLGERVMNYLGADVFFNFFLDESQGRLHLNACGGISEGLARELEWLDLGAAVCGWVALHQQPAALEDIDLHQDPRAGLVRSMGVRAYACHPVFVDGQAVGTLSFGARSRGAFSEDELGLMRVITDYVAIAMQRSRNAEALRDLNDTLEQRVAQRTVQLRALAAELSRAEERERKRLARVLHDHLQQLLVAARLNVNSLVRRLADPSMHKAAQQLDEVLEEAIRTSRSLTAELSPPVLYDAGLTAALHWLARWFDEKYGLRVDVEAEELGNTTPETARAMLFQAARELLFNVVKHAGVKRAKVYLRRLPVGELELVISDYGMGFDPAQVEPTTEGGFGLFHLTERLEMLGGRIEVQSVPGQGTRIRLQVPEQQAGVQEVAAAEEVVGQIIRREATPPGKQETAHRPPLRVLLVDDHPIVREGLAHLLADEAGIQLVGQANNGREALELAHATRPDVVLMDVSMPVMDGIEATGRITEELPEIKVIGLSMYADPEVSQRIREAGAVDHIPKGGDPAALIQAIRQWARHE